MKIAAAACLGLVAAVAGSATGAAANAPIASAACGVPGSEHPDTNDGAAC